MCKEVHMSQRHVWEGIATLIGVIIGAGMLGIPYVVSQAGFWTGIVVIIVLGCAALLMNLLLGEIVLRTPGNHQLTGYAAVYLGSWGRRLMWFSMVFGIYGALIAYLLAEGESLAALFGGSPAVWQWVFYAAASLTILYGLKAVRAGELVFSNLKLILFVVAVAVIAGSGKTNASFLSGFDASRIFLPFGVVLFALSGTAAIPEVREELRGHWRDLRKALIIGSAVPIIVYLLWALAVVAVTGPATTEVATLGIGQFLGATPALLVNSFAVVAMLTAFLGLGLALREMYEYDYKMRTMTAWLLVVTVPAVFVLSGFHGFIRILGLTGALGIGIAAVLIVLMHQRAITHGTRKPEYAIRLPFAARALIVLVFIIGMALEIVNVVRGM